MTLALEIILWSSIGLVAAAYVGYPLAIYVASRLFGRRPVPRHDAAAEETGRELPKVSVLVSALNEEKMIAERIENNLAQDYPAERLEIVVASDGSTDRTASIVRDFAERFPGRVRLLDYPVRRGKATVLNESIPALPGEIVVLSDANTFFEPPAITRLVRWFDDPQVGVVCGKPASTVSPSKPNADPRTPCRSANNSAAWAWAASLKWLAPSTNSMISSVSLLTKTAGTGSRLCSAK